MTDVHAWLDALARRVEHPSFIGEDPISVPHGFSDPRDQEVIGLFAALLAWGRRATVLNKLADLSHRMGYKPYSFVLHFDEARDASRLEGFVHRTFNDQDAIALVRNLQHLLRTFGSLEAAFLAGWVPGAPHIGEALEAFASRLLTSHPDTPTRLRKHIGRPSTGSACKRMCMYLRWMVRSGPVDLHLWRSIPTSALVLPLDVHSGRVGRALGLLQDRYDRWSAALELTASCRALRPEDPCFYDYALFGAGVLNEPLPQTGTPIP